MKPVIAQAQKDEAFAWIRECLDSDKALARLVLDRMPLHEASIMAVVPADAPYENVRSGFGSREASTRILYEYLSSWRGPDVVVVVADDLLTRKDHATWQDFGTHILIYGDDLYHWSLLADFKNPEELDEFLNWSSTGHPLDVFIVRTRMAESWEPEQNLDTSAIEALADETQIVIVGAYDSDGFLLIPLGDA
jgi:hypothetical protein